MEVIWLYIDILALPEDIWASINPCLRDGRIDALKEVLSRRLDS